MKKSKVKEKFYSTVGALALVSVIGLPGDCLAEDLQIQVLDSDTSWIVYVDVDYGTDWDDIEDYVSAFEVDDTQHINDLLPHHEETKIPQLVTVRHYCDSWGNGIQTAYGKWNTVLIENKETFPELYAALAEQSAAETAYAKSEFTDMSETAKSDYEMREDKDYFYAYDYDSQVQITRADDAFISVLYSRYEYLGGAHGYSWFEGHTYDVQTGEEVGLMDIVADTDALLDALYNELNNVYPGLSGLQEDQLQDYWGAVTAENLVWSLEPDGISFDFAAYRLGYYAEGPQHVTLTYREYPNLFTEKVKTVRDMTMMELNPWQEVRIDVDNDEMADTVVMNFLYGDDYDMYKGLSIRVDEQETEFDSYFYNASMQLFRRNAETYLYVWLSVEEELSQLLVFDLSSGSAVYTGTMDFGPVCWDGEISTVVYSEVLADLNEFRLMQRTDILGTSTAYGYFKVGTEGLPEAVEGEHYITQPFELITKQEIQGTSVVRNEPGIDDTILDEERPAIIPAGTAVKVTATDNLSFADLQTDTGTTIRVPVEGSEYPQTSDGVDIDLLFDGIVFVG